MNPTLASSLDRDPAEARARTRRPEGWTPSGPAPRGNPEGRPELRPGPDEDLSYLTGDFRIFQLRSGHRWSLDDFVTAWVALEQARRAAVAGAPVRTAVDLGCGIGSVLMMLAWGLPEARVVGVEAQAISAAMARRSIAYNGIDDRAEVRLGDLRDDAIVASGERFDLVTGTPPYIPIGAGLISEKAQRGPCCFETRGGVEDYARAAARLLRDGGTFVACAGAWPEDRAERAATAGGLRVLRRVDVVPREGKPVLFRVVVARKGSVEPAGAPAIERFVVRDANGAIAPDMSHARARMGLPP